MAAVIAKVISGAECGIKDVDRSPNYLLNLQHGCIQIHRPDIVQAAPILAFVDLQGDFAIDFVHHIDACCKRTLVFEFIILTVVTIT